MVRTKFPIKKRNKPGPKRVFTKGMLEEAENLVGTYGARSKELALYFDVCEKTIEHWIRTCPAFERAVKRGRVHVGLKVSKALVSVAQGFNHPAIHFVPNRVVEETLDEDGKVIGRITRTEVIKVPYTKHYPPNPYAANKYLTIMFREVWAEPTEFNINHNHSGTINHRKIEDIPIEELSKQEQDLVFQLNMKQLRDVNSN